MQWGGRCWCSIVTRLKFEAWRTSPWGGGCLLGSPVPEGLKKTTFDLVLGLQPGTTPPSPEGVGACLSTPSRHSETPSSGVGLMQPDGDEGIDFKSMGRIFMGLVKCGAWGCFDEFNRLKEDQLSAISDMIQVIQAALKLGEDGTLLTAGRHTPFFLH